MKRYGNERRRDAVTSQRRSAGGPLASSRSGPPSSTTAQVTAQREKFNSRDVVAVAHGTAERPTKEQTEVTNGADGARSLGRVGSLPCAHGRARGAVGTARLFGAVGGRLTFR